MDGHVPLDETSFWLNIILHQQGGFHFHLSEPECICHPCQHLARVSPIGYPNTLLVDIL